MVELCSPHYIHHRKYILKLNKPEIYVRIAARKPDIRADIMDFYTFCFLSKNLLYPGVFRDLRQLVLLQNVVLRFLIYENFLRRAIAALGVF